MGKLFYVYIFLCIDLYPKDILSKNRDQLCGFILGVLMHTTALDQHCGRDETLEYWIKIWKILQQDIFHEIQKRKICNTWKYPLHWYFLGVLMHTTSWDQHCGRDETLEYWIKIWKILQQDIFNEIQKRKICNTWKYPLRGYFLGVLMHTTAWDQHWGWDETLEYQIKICKYQSDEIWSLTMYMHAKVRILI